MEDHKPMLKNSESRYGAVSITLHWLMFLLIAAVYACIELRELYPRGSDPREALKTWHFMLGLTVFCLVWVRIAIYALWPRPAIHPAPSAWQVRLARLVHLLLFLLMVGMPIGGWLILSGEGDSIPFWGLQLPPLMAQNEALAETIESVHKTVGKIGYFLIGAHALAALIHHYFLKDNTLRRMLPGGK